MRGASATWLLLALAEGCGFSPGAAANGDAPPPIDGTPDTPPAPIPRWVVAGVTKTTSSLVIHPFAKVFGTPCPNQTSPLYTYRSFLPRASTAFIYGVESEFWGLALGCANTTPTMVSGGGPRAIQRIVLSSSQSVGFFTADGTLALGVYRFTASSDGTPTVGGSANAPSAAGALALDSTNSDLYIAGTSAVYQYSLQGAALDFPATGTQVAAPMCTSPIDLLLSGDSILAFCSDSPDIRHYVREPFAYDGNVGALGAVTQVVPLRDDRALAATQSPATLVILSLNHGAPVVNPGTPLASAATAIAVSDDGLVAVTARQIDVSNSEITAWSISGTTLTKLDSETQAGTVTALAITTPGT